MRRGLLFSLALLPGLLVGCGSGVDEELRPDQLLRDSLALGDADRVYRITLDAPENRERAEPREVQIVPGSFVEFFTADGRIHTVTFPPDSLAGEAAEFLRSTGQDRSPPLVERESRFLVSFRDAPAGRYPFRIEGNGQATWGAVVVPPRG